MSTKKGFDKTKVAAIVGTVVATAVALFFAAADPVADAFCESYLAGSAIEAPAATEAE